MRLPTLTGEFRVAQDLELRFTAGGKAVLGLALIASESKKNPNTDQWEDGDRTPFVTATLWEREAEALVDAGVEKGERVLVTGAMFERTYQRNDGAEGRSVELKYATVAQVPGGKPRNSQSAASTSQRRQQPAGQQQRRQPPEDPWATPSSGGHDDEPPF